MNKRFFALLFLGGLLPIFLSSVCAQDKFDLDDIRRAYMLSDVVIAAQYSTISNYTSDFSREVSYKVSRIDHTFINRTNFTLSDSIRVPLISQEFPFAKDLRILSIIEPEIAYTNFLFLKKTGSTYKLVAETGYMEWKYIKDLSSILEGLEPIRKTVLYDERYFKTIDWYIENDCYPNQEFFEFYKQKRVINDTIRLTGAQTARALKLYLQGYEELYDFIKDKHQDKIHRYSLNKMKEIYNMKEPGFFDFYRFSKMAERVLQSEYGSSEYILFNLLTQSNINPHQKREIMNALIEKAKKEIANKEK